MSMIMLCIQIKSLEGTFEQERKALKHQVFELQRKLEQATQDLATVQSTLALRTADLAALQSNLKELEELREMKEVTAFDIFCNFQWKISNTKYAYFVIPVF